jgi:hypothetical protein
MTPERREDQKAIILSRYPMNPNSPTRCSCVSIFRYVCGRRYAAAQPGRVPRSSVPARRLGEEGLGARNGGEYDRLSVLLTLWERLEHDRNVVLEPALCAHREEGAGFWDMKVSLRNPIYHSEGVIPWKPAPPLGCPRRRARSPCARGRLILQQAR